MVEEKVDRRDRLVLGRPRFGLDQRGKLGSRHHRNQRIDAAALLVVQRRIGAALDQHAHRFDIGGPRGANQSQVGDLRRRRQEARIAIEQRLRQAVVEIGAMRQHQLEQLERALGTRRNLVLADVVHPVTSLDHGEEAAAVRTGARFHEHLRRIEMEVVERNHDRRETLRRLRIDVGSRLDQHAQSGDSAVSRCEHHRRQTGRRDFDEVAHGGLSVRQIVRRSSRVDVRARRDQRGGHFAAIVRGRVHQRRLSLPALDDVDLCAALDEQPDGVHAARPRREHERCFALRQREIDVRACVEECLEQPGVGAKSSLVHRSDAVPVREIGVAFRAEQRLHATDVPEVGGVEHRRSNRPQPSRWRRRPPRAARGHPWNGHSELRPAASRRGRVPPKR